MVYEYGWVLWCGEVVEIVGLCFLVMFMCGGVVCWFKVICVELMVV